MERIAIINHDTHELFIEDIDENILESKYNGQEEEYIKDNYANISNFSWDYIVDATYIPKDYDAIGINFDEL